MKNFERILVILDPKHEKHIEIDKAIEIASRSRASVDVVIFQHSSELPRLKTSGQIDELKQTIETALSERVVEVLNQLKTDHINVSVRVEWCEHMAVTAIDLVKKYHYDLLVKTPNRVSPLGRLVSRPTDWNILRTCPCSVWIVKPENESRNGILAAVDLDDDDIESHNAKNNSMTVRVVEQANYLSKLFDQKLEIINAFPALPVAAHVQFVSVFENDYLQQVERERRRSLENLLSSMGITEQNCHVFAGEASQVIVNYTESNQCSLLVLGTNARDGLSGLLTGNTAESIISQVECDILVVKSADFTAPSLAEFVN
ncbi:universal stress protein [Aliikangiella coralliicola]|uniref:UspA domain-containing protein n=1 Tax=Aliikangiella coralliicola TaxID=2592383 RepID=A0A545U900_9GAMM|nr:universal stress protein [Aliikangiella coralliicola]TQV85951.1 hypothetical protein FLL46_18710 [Aliikangiella coralliicola]